MKNKHQKVARRMALVVLSLVVLSGALCVEATAETSGSLSKKELKALLTTAKTPADHQRIAAYYRSNAQRLTAKALEFSAEADRLATQPATIESKQGISCNCTSHYRYWSKQYAQEAKESETLAAAQEQLSQNYQANSAQK
jgi:septal ring factor EnvC (AmiA/AmiB activator)